MMASSNVIGIQAKQEKLVFPNLKKSIIKNQRYQQYRPEYSIQGITSPMATQETKSHASLNISLQLLYWY